MSMIAHTPFELTRIHNNNNNNLLLLPRRNRMRQEQQIHSVQRILFGKVDPQCTKKFLEDELEKELKINSENWNFDFKNEKPMNEDGDYVWKKATPESKVQFNKTNREEFEFDTSSCYYQPQVEEEEIHRKLTANEQQQQQQSFDENNRKISSDLPKQQSLITDYMTTKKRSSGTEYQKKASISERPAKIPKFNITS